MTLAASLYHRFQRYRTLQTDEIRSLPIVILMPHSACNCRCVMCDIWKDNKNLRQLTEADIIPLLAPLKKLGTQQVLMSGGEALLNPLFFRFCELLGEQQIKVTLLSTGLTLKKNAEQLVKYVQELIVSLDGDETTHDEIRNIPSAFRQLREGIASLKKIKPGFRVRARTVIHRMNFRKWPDIIRAAKSMDLDQISFLPADVSSHAFNREVLWSDKRQQEIVPDEAELPELKNILEKLFLENREDFESGFIAESPLKLQRIYQYYAAWYGKEPYPFKKCNAPWVSTVIEADGTVRPCFFHAPIGNIREQGLDKILNGGQGIRFRRELDMKNDSTCARCVCYLHLSPGTTIN